MAFKTFTNSVTKTDNPTTTRPSFRVMCQQEWRCTHIELNMACLQTEPGVADCDVVCKRPAEAGTPSCMCARLNNPAYGLNDAPRKWWDRVDTSLRSCGVIQSPSYRDGYVMHEDDTLQHRIRNATRSSCAKLRARGSTPHTQMQQHN